MTPLHPGRTGPLPTDKHNMYQESNVHKGQGDTFVPTPNENQSLPNTLLVRNLVQFSIGSGILAPESIERTVLGILSWLNERQIPPTNLANIPKYWFCSLMTHAIKHELQNHGSYFINPQQTVKDWIELYNANQDSGLRVIMQFFIYASGCKGKITEEMQNSMKYDEMIQKMTEEFDKDNDEYPIIVSDPLANTFHGKFCDFIETLVGQCPDAILCDHYFMNNVISFLAELSNSEVRAFRHTATLAAMKLMTALVNVAVSVSVNLERSLEVYEAELQKARDGPVNGRLKELMAYHVNAEDKLNEIKNMLRQIFTTVFVQRYDDQFHEIRGICVVEIAVWMKRYPQFFLDDFYLGYIGGFLFDEVGGIRLKCLQGLQPLFDSEELQGKIKPFITIFKDRIVSMALANECDVAALAVQLMTRIFRYHRDILTNEDCKSVYKLKIFSRSKLLRVAAMEFAARLPRPQFVWRPEKRTFDLWWPDIS